MPATNTSQPDSNNDTGAAELLGNIAKQPVRNTHITTTQPTGADDGRDGELEEYVKDMFLMVWRDATIGLGADKHVVVNSATSMVMKRITAATDARVREARLDQMEYVEQRLIGKNTSGDRVFYDKDAVIAENRLLDRQRVISAAMKAEIKATLTPKGQEDE